MTVKTAQPVPPNIGDNAAKALIGPNPEYWPIDISKKNVGSPITSIIIINGMRKAPEIKLIIKNFFEQKNMIL